jgi:CRP-like cAMP-binding protein
MFERVPLALRQTLEEPDEFIGHVYFPEDGIISVVGAAPGELEVCIIGKEGMTGLMAVLGNDHAPFRTFVQVEGSALRIKRPDLKKAMDSHPSIRMVFLRFVQVFMIQTALTAVANASGYLPQRLARWLLMCEDRLTTKQIPLTHEFFAVMLGVQRPGVTLAVNELESKGLIKASRGLITIIDRPALLELAGEFYGRAEREYERRLGAKAK